MYQIEEETAVRRIYRSTLTGTRIATKVIYTDGAGDKWWAFEDLLQIPFIRKKASERMSQLYGIGINKEDIEAMIARLKGILREDTAERYERAYSEVLNMEAIINQTADPVRESLSLCTVYIMREDEQVDSFSAQLAAAKIERWALDLDAQAFFLNWLTDSMNDLTAAYSIISKIASNDLKS